MSVWHSVEYLIVILHFFRIRDTDDSLRQTRIHKICGGCQKSYFSAFKSKFNVLCLWDRQDTTCNYVGFWDAEGRLWQTSCQQQATLRQLGVSMLKSHPTHVSSEHQKKREGLCFCEAAADWRYAQMFHPSAVGLFSGKKKRFIALILFQGIQNFPLWINRNCSLCDFKVWMWETRRAFLFLHCFVCALLSIAQYITSCPFSSNYRAAAEYFRSKEAPRRKSFGFCMKVKFAQLCIMCQLRPSWMRQPAGSTKYLMQSRSSYSRPHISPPPSQQPSSRSLGLSLHRSLFPSRLTRSCSVCVF